MIIIKICLILTVFTLTLVSGATTAKPTVKVTSSPIVLKTFATTSLTKGSTVITTLSPAEQLLIDLGSDAANFKKLENVISGVTEAPAHAAAPAAPPAPKKQLSLGNPVAQISQAEKNRAVAEKQIKDIATKMAEIEQLNLLNTQPSPKESKPSGNSAPAAQSSNSLPSSSSSSSDKSGSYNAKVIGSAVGGSLACVALLVGAVFAIIYKKRKGSKKSEEAVKNDIGDEANYGGADEDLE